MIHGNNSKRGREEVVVSSTERPGWVSASDRPAKVGDAVFCTGGPGVLRAILGKTGDGSRLLEIRLDDPGAKPFFAAASNVLVAPE